MTEQMIPDPSDLREGVIREHSAQARADAAYNIAAASMYHWVETGDPERFRNAAQWIITNGHVSARSLRLDDDEYLREKKIAHLEVAKAKVDEAGRIESWAGSIFDTKDSPDIIALRELGIFAGLPIDSIELRPEFMLKYEDETNARAEHANAMRADLEDISERLETRTGLETINVSLAVRQSNPKQKDTVTIVGLAEFQKEILSGMLADAEAEVSIRTALIEVFRTGKASEALKQAVSSKNPHVFKAIGPEILHNQILIEELDVGVRAYNCLKRVGVTTLTELASKTEEELRAIPNLGDKAIAEIAEALSAHGLSLRSEDQAP